MGTRTPLRLVVATIVAVTVTTVSGATAAPHVCLYGASSMAVALVDGHEVVTQAPHETGCTR